ncbi:unnamed protein product [Closterium sp. Naga37s-1]|nr:unnamed protein product [Closterium sp. Naga37s-1]
MAGVLTETTVELAASLTQAAARHVVEADYFMCAGKYDGWLPTMRVHRQPAQGAVVVIIAPLLPPPPPLPLHARFIGNLLKGQTVGIIGAGRIGSAYARMIVRREGGGMGKWGKGAMGGMAEWATGGNGRWGDGGNGIMDGWDDGSVEGFKMNLIYFDLYQSKRLEESVIAYSRFLQSQGEPQVTWRRVSSPEEVLQVADVDAILGLVTDKVALWTCVFHACLPVTSMPCLHSPSSPLQDAILVNCSRGPVVDEVALLKHLKANPAFRAALDVFEDKPLMKPGLSTLPNVVVVPHIASASQWTRAGMAGLAALNVTVSAACALDTLVLSLLCRASPPPLSGRVPTLLKA